MKLTQQHRTIVVRVLSAHWYVDIEVQAASASVAAATIRQRDPSARVEITPRGNVIVHAA